MHDLDALDALHGFDRLADDALGFFHQTHAQRRHACLGAEHVVRLVHHAQCFGLYLAAQAQRHGFYLVGVGVGLGLRAQGRATVGAGAALGAGSAGQAQRLVFGGLRGGNQIDGFLALSYFYFSGGENFFFSRNRQCAGNLRSSLRFAL